MDTPENSAEHARQDEIDALCVDFELAGRGNRSPQIEVLLSQVDAQLRADVVCELVAIEVRLRQAAGEHVTRREYEQRFPEYGAQVATAFEDLRPSTQHERETYHTPAQSTVSESVPDTIGRYRIERRLGAGAFGAVYLATDPELDRSVAVKIPLHDCQTAPDSLERLAEEARTAAQLVHPSIVTVHDVVHEGSRVGIIQQYVEGQSLAESLREGALSPRRAAEIALAVADALAYAHQRGFVHRDLKPGNILLDRVGHPRVADFGLAIHEHLQRRRMGERAGTPEYMSPEQVRGETHRLDGRSDIWSLGVVLYEMLTGRLPFTSRDADELFQEIEYREPRPLRQINPGVPADLQRISLKCLEKRIADRYSSAADLMEDLSHWLGGRASDGSAGCSEVVAKIVPRGLRSFGPEDADFFLVLLPGPRDRDGLPESIRFWKSRIEQVDAGRTFTVGLVYGPSGCGKSSLIRAGLLPRLADHVVSVYVQATATDTESLLADRLHSACPDLPAAASLVELLQLLRGGSGLSVGRKLLIVIDQFEQWLHVHSPGPQTQLVRALRHCDGGRLQCLCLVRDEFWLATSRFFRALETELVEGNNATLVDLFDPPHARKVLADFGQAYGRLPPDPTDWTAGQRAFVDHAVDGLEQGGKVDCIRLALLADMMKGRPWTTTSLKQTGGTAGLGVAFLDQTFNSPHAPAACRVHRKAACRVLRALLPEPGIDIKSCQRTREQLLEASGYQQRPDDFQQLMRILDSDLRLVTPTDAPDTRLTHGKRQPAQPRPRNYQLTHDYLVGSLREWSTRQQRETRRGRAELLLADRAGFWNASPSRRLLPTWWEYAGMRVLTNPHTWSGTQRRMMHDAARFHGLRWGIALLILILAGIGIQQYFVAQAAYLADQQKKNVRLRAGALVKALWLAPTDAIPYAIENLRPVQGEAVLLLRRELRDAHGAPDRRLRAACALALLDRADADRLVPFIRSAASGELRNIALALRRDAERARESLREESRRAEEGGDWSRKARLALVALSLRDGSLVRDMFRLRPDPCQRTALIDFLPSCPEFAGDLLRFVRGADDTALRSGAVLGIGQLSRDALPREARQPWEQLLLDWFENANDGATHSAADWVLRRWKFEKPELASTTAPEQGRDWYVNEQGMTMLKIAMPGKLIYLCDRETSVETFQRFVADRDYPDTEKPRDWSGPSLACSPTEKHPVQRISWLDAILFCNWLSDTEHLAPCYERTGKASHVFRTRGTVEFDAWTCDPSRAGYRLPTQAEWEWAFRAETTTKFFFGDDILNPPIYVSMDLTGAERCGTRPPNPWGFFDLQGNVSEWCQDERANLARVFCGGSFRHMAFLSGVVQRPSPQTLDTFFHGGASALPFERQDYLGFRVARTVK